VLASPSTALEVVPRALSALGERFGAARLYVETQFVREMVGQLVRNEADLAISTLPIDNALLASEVVGSWNMVCVFAAGHAFEARTRLTMGEVLAEPLVGFAPDTPQGRLITDWCDAQQVQPHARIEVRSGQAACALCVAGAGVSIVDNLTARAWQGKGLAYRPLTRTDRFDVFAVHGAHAPRSVLARSFIALVKAEFKALRGRQRNTPPASPRTRGARAPGSR
jgi:DNA-binding transcriptional LysR family regulator